jgi:hypothetical protein
MAISNRIFFAALSLASVQAMAQCYTVYDRAERVVYQGRESPVDMTRPLRETVVGLFPGGHLVLDNVTQDCGAVRPTMAVVPAAGKMTGVPDTRTMGAGPRGGAPSVARATVITELKNPPMRISREANGPLLFESIDH